MDERIARLRTHQKNIDRYQGLLRTKLSELESQFLERRLSEERQALATLEFLTPRLNTETKAPEGLSATR
jgi:hypothetical protein